MAAEVQITVVHDRDDRRQHAEFLHSLADIQEERLVCEITPGPRTLQRLAHAMLVGLGKQPELTGAARNSEEEWRRVEAWVAGERPREVVVWRAQQLARGHWERLMALPLRNGARLSLVVHGTTTSRGQREAIRDHGLTEIGFERFRARLEPVAHPAPAPAPSDDFPRVPPDEFPLFLAKCRELLSARAFQRVEARYWQAHDEALSWARRDGAIVAQLQRELTPFVRGLLRSTDSLDEMLVCLRGAQAALLGRGYLLGIDRDSLAAGYAATPRAQLDEHTARRLRRLAPTHLAALGVIALIATPIPAELAALDLSAVRSNGASVRVGEERLRVPEVGRGILRSHLAYRRAQGASAGEPLFVTEGSSPWSRSPAPLKRVTAHGVQLRLRQVALETGVPVSSSEGWLRTDRRWLRRRGINLRGLKRAA